MNIQTRFNIGEKVKVFYNYIENGEVKNNVGVIVGTITEIVIRKDILTNDIYCLYRLSANNCLYSEKSLAKSIF